MQFIGTGYVKDGQFKARNSKAYETAFAKWPDCEVTITIERDYATRNVEQNKLYWVGYVKPLCQYTGYTKNEMHTYLKQRFLPAHKRVMKRLLLSDVNGVVIDDVEIDMSSTTTLSKPDFSEYLHDIEVFAASIPVMVGSNREEAA